MLHVVLWSSILFNLAIMVRLVWLERRWVRLIRAWDVLCLEAYFLRHWPHLVCQMRDEELAAYRSLQAND